MPITAENRVWTDEEDWIVANSVEQVRAFIVEQYGESHWEMVGDQYHMLPREAEVTICDDIETGPEPRTTKTAALWAADPGPVPRLICSTNW